MNMQDEKLERFERPWKKKYRRVYRRGLRKKELGR
jgi:hypothetical protein